MRLVLEINNKTGCKIEAEYFDRIVKATISEAGYNFLESKDIVVSLAMVDDEEIKKINKKYRKKDKVTDILSFPNYEKEYLLKKRLEKKFFLGELIICCRYIEKSAKINKVSLNEEIARIISHGTLHLLGLKHGEKMFAIQNKIADNLTSK